LATKTVAFPPGSLTSQSGHPRAYVKGGHERAMVDQPSGELTAVAAGVEHAAPLHVS
jgi:hypothetical protein